MKPVNSFNDDQKEEEDSNISFGGKGKLQYCYLFCVQNMFVSLQYYKKFFYYYRKTL